MRIDLSSIDREQFIVQEHLIAGEVCTLVTPQHIGCEWKADSIHRFSAFDNLHFRSSLWNNQGELINASYRKHFNWTEKPDVTPGPVNLDEMTLVEKIDGSTLLISRYRDTLICRTRGTVDATRMANGHEIALFKERYPKLFDAASDRYTMVLEWVSPENIIVIPYSQPDVYLTNIIHHHDYSYTEQNHLDRLAEMMEVKRPRTYSFASVEQMLKEVEGFKGIEGICAYYPMWGIRDNCYRKAKGQLYLSLHRFKEKASLPNTIELWFSQGKPDPDTFKANLIRDFDHECWTLVAEYWQQTMLAYANVRHQIDKIQDHLNWKLFTNDQAAAALLGEWTPTRRDYALAIQTAFQSPWTGVAFKLLDKREIDDKMLRSLMEHELGI